MKFTPSVVLNGSALMRDRFVGFAFAAAELLIETNPAGTIQFATGAFTRWFGVSGPELIGRSLGSLLSGEDQATLAICLSVANVKGRIAPVNVRLANVERTPMALAGLSRPDAKQAICFTLGRMPENGYDHGDEFLAPEYLAGAMQSQIAQGVRGAIGLVEVTGLPTARAGAAGESIRMLRDNISSQLARSAGPRAQAQQISEGRYGVLAEGKFDIDEVVRALEAYLTTIPEAAAVSVRGSGIMLEPDDALTSQQASSAIRYALGRFAAGGLAASNRAGFADGLLGFVKHASAEARIARASIKSGRFTLRFQPIVALSERAVHHFEALIRPVATEQNPTADAQEFVSFAEAVGLAEELDLAVIGKAIEVMRQAPWASVAMNISGISAQNPEFRSAAVSLIRDAVERNHARPLVELTETVEISDVAEAAITAAELRAAGAAMCLDDFGAGAASYRYLRDFRVDYVKIDGSFVRRALTDAKSHGMILSIVELANFVGAKVIAEMVETEAQAKLMREAGIDFGQGWLFGKPGHLPGVSL